MDIKAVIILVALANLALGGLLFFRGRRNRASIAFAITSASFALWTLALYFYEHPIWFSSFIWIKIVYSIVLIPIIPSYFYFALVFPQSPKARKKVIIPMLSYFLPAIFLFYILWFTDLWVQKVIVTPQGVKTILGPAYLYFIIFASIFGFVWFLGILLKKYLKAIGISKMQLRYIFLGLFLCISFIIILDGLIPLLTGNSSFFWMSPLGSLFSVIATVYAITRYRLMDVRLILRKSGVFLLALAIVVGLTISAIWLMAYLMNYRANPMLMLGGGIAMAVTVLFFIPLRSFLQKLADNLLFKRITSYQEALKKISNKFILD